MDQKQQGWKNWSGKVFGGGRQGGRTDGRGGVGGREA